MPELKPRQKIIAETIKSLGGGIAADIGCDHGLLPVSLVKSGICRVCYAADLSIHSMEKTARNIKRFGLSGGGVIPVNSDGLGFLALPEFSGAAEKIKFIVLSGLGGESIYEIISRRVLKGAVYILQPNTALFELRMALSEGGFEILGEAPVKDGGRLYITLTAKFTGKTGAYSVREALLGRHIAPSHPLYSEYFDKNISRLRKVLAGLNKLPPEKRESAVTSFGGAGEIETLLKQITE